MSQDFYTLVSKLDELAKPKQLPALFKPVKVSPVLGNKDKEHPAKDYFVGEDESKDKTTEDVVSSVKKKLGDYLADLSKEIKSDSDLKDKTPQEIDRVSPAVKTITTDDGHEIKIHGNEDDGFRITIKDKQASAKFNNLDEAVMACEMFCSHRRKQNESIVEPTPVNVDYVEEKKC